MRTFSRFVQLVLHIPNAMLLLLQGRITGKKIKLFGFVEFFKLSARVNPASLNLSTVIFFFKYWTSYTSYTQILGLPKLLFVLEIT